MKLLLKTSLLICLLFNTVSCVSRPAAGSGPQCGFADPELMTEMALCDLVAGHYVAHHQWPQSRTQLEQRWHKVVEASKEDMQPAETQELKTFFSRFTLLEFQKSGPELLLHYRFMAGRKTVDQTLRLKPGATVDAILQTAEVQK